MQEISFNKILIGFAFSPNLKANVFEAIRLADFFGAHLYFLHVGSKSATKKQALNDLLEESPIKLKKISFIWQEGKPVETIVDQCKKNGVDLLLLGALQRENMVKFYMGSIARKLTRKAPCSVLLMIKPSVIRKPSQHVVVNAFESPQTKTTINSAFYFAQALGIPKLTLVEEIDRSKVAALAYDDRSLRKVTLRKEKLKRRELSRVREILRHIPDILKENIQVHLQNIFGTRGYSIGHYARVVRADLLIMNAAENRKSFLERIFPKDLEHILSELPTDVLIIQSKDNG
ncbi:MAG: universal stress protein [Flavobacteriaceae bacterium]|nr:universal stress protein [Flavobacteriaceae bacterium]